MARTEFEDRKTGDKVMAEQYVQGVHPPPRGVSVTAGSTGILARAHTVHGELSVVYDGDWLVSTGDGPDDLLTDSYMRATYKRVGEDDPVDKPLVLG